MKKAEAVAENVKVVRAELLPSAESILRPGVDKAILDRLVQQKVAEIMAERESAVMEPFFRSRQIAFEIRRLQTVPEQDSWHVFFERNGCLYCHSKERIHGGCGCCVRCYPRILREKQSIIRELMDNPRTESQQMPGAEAAASAGTTEQAPNWRRK